MPGPGPSTRCVLLPFDNSRQSSMSCSGSKPVRHSAWSVLPLLTKGVLLMKPECHRIPCSKARKDASHPTKRCRFCRFSCVLRRSPEDPGHLEGRAGAAGLVGLPDLARWTAH